MGIYLSYDVRFETRRRNSGRKYLISRELFFEDLLLNILTELLVSFRRGAEVRAPADIHFADDQEVSP